MYVIQIDYDIDVYHIHENVYHICENVVHELLKSCRSISKPFRHYQPLKGSVLVSRIGFTPKICSEWFLN